MSEGVFRTLTPDLMLLQLSPTSSSANAGDLRFRIVLRTVQMSQVDHYTVGDTVLIVGPVTTAANGYVPVAGTIAG